MVDGGAFGLGEQAPRFESIAQDLSAVGVFMVGPFSRDWPCFGFHFEGGSPAVGNVKVALAIPDPSGKVNVQNVRDVIDPAIFPVIKVLERETRYVFVYVRTAVAGASVIVTAAEGHLVPVGGTAAALSGLAVSPVERVIANESNPAPAAASADVLGANPNRIAYQIRNASAERCYLSFGGVAAATSFYIEPGETYREEGSSIWRGTVAAMNPTIIGDLRIVEWQKA